MDAKGVRQLKRNIFPPRASRTTSRNKDLIEIRNLIGTFVKDLIYSLLDAKDEGYLYVKLDFSRIGDNHSVYPETIVPISAFMEQLKTEEGMTFDLVSAPPYLEHTHFADPQPAGFTGQYPNILNKVWKFSSSEDVFKLVTEYIDELYKSDVVEGDNVLKALEWSLNEVMDNVIQHAEVQTGYVMGQIHPTTKHFAFCVADYGRGIYNSLRSSGMHRPQSPEDALTLALQEGITRDKQVGQGNGLWGLKGFATQGTGRLRLASSGSILDMSRREEVNF